MIFRQTPEPSRTAPSDFTDGEDTDGEEDRRAFQWKDRPTNELGVTIADAPFAHRLHHFVLACGGWDHAGVVRGGGSFTALAETLRTALRTLGRRAARASHRQPPARRAKGPPDLRLTLLTLSQSQPRSRGGCDPALR